MLRFRHRCFDHIDGTVTDCLLVVLGVAMVMSVRRAPPLPLIFLLMIHEVSSADWGVNYRDSHICALKDSSVIMSCNYTYSTGYEIKKVFWTKNSVEVGEEYPDLSEDPEYSQRLQYLGDKQKTCTIRLSHVTQKDSHKYYFSPIAYETGFWKKSVNWIGDPGVSLTVTDLQVESPETVTEGDSVRLTCKSSCALTDRATFIWYRNSKKLTKRRDRNNKLLLQSVRREDAGRYSCGVQEHTYISPAVQLRVTYPPNSVSVSISPSGEIVEGDSVTLICSSDSNPPAEISWFKGGSFLRSGRIYSISKISSNHSGEYKCKSSNKHGWKYSAVTLNVMNLQVESPENVTEGQNVSLTCVSSCALTDRATFIWYRNSKPLTERRDRNNQLLLQSVRREDAGRYSCGVQGHTYISPAVQLNVTYPPNSVSVSISPSGEIVEGDSVNLICSSDSNPPAEITWFKEGRFLGSGRIYSISKISSNHSGEYKCKSSNKHGWKYSAVTLNVMYPPKDVAVSNFSLSGVIVEGDSVTLICSSDSNPPADINWFKGRMFVGSGRNYSISKSSSNHSGEYKCKASNKHGEKYSDAVILNVMYPPKSVSVSISPSGEIVEGDSVTLSCSSDSNPPAEITWFKEGRFLGSGRIYRISNISSNHSGEYKCKSSNKHGEKDSDTVMLNVTYAPRNAVVSISPSGEIVEGDSVTLICSSDSNPPAEINWFKGGTFVGSGRNYSISNISSNHSGEYKCKSSNKHGEKDSDTVMLNVTYAPRNVMVSISPPGEIVEGDSVTVICSSDSNPPALNFSWFKGGTFVRSGRNYSISNISSNHSGEYKCMSNNKHGEKDSDTVMLNVTYAPRNAVVSIISPSGEIVEGDSVTLICSSDSNPPALDFSWFKEGTFVESGRIYSISNISSNHSGEYKCKSKNKHGEKDSDTVMLNVTYAPRNVMVSISPPGEIVEGDSVTLICSSDSNPPALNFSWFKGGTFVRSGRNYSISNISSNHSGEYKCMSNNKHGEKDSDTVMLNVTYAPRNAVVSIISPSGEIVEGDSVTLICSSDSNPPALDFSWFKEGTFVESGRIYSISNISSNHSGEYKCKSKNKHGEKDSDTVMLNVTYAPRNVMMSISPSGEIVEGDSVNLICSSDSNPPALNFSWFKEETFVGSGRNYSISNISSNHSGEYKCKSNNKHGEKDSDTVMLNVTYAPKNIMVSTSPIVEGESVTHKHVEKYSNAMPLNVMYPPKNVSVYINGSAETVEGDSVTLICSSDSNPPALNFSWFKENQSSSVGSGQSFSALQSGRFYCEAHNQHGSQRSDAVTVTVKEHHGSRWHEVFGITVECGVSFIIVTITIIIIMFIIKKLRSFKYEYITMTQISESSEDTYRLLELQSTTSDLYGTLTTLHPTPLEGSCTTAL
ncbi:Fc receptor-like protein 5 isoform X6 [Carassius auratus]|uniref:Fc receptor-like protein 5 isoform X6 n=1 Tax=Carassius auratus TaxID=7957 RepID=A0A6P6NHW1_CARAU|nr:Fc receptor-like protein 5 isoform X6 [Carassius auratus]